MYSTAAAYTSNVSNIDTTINNKNETRITVQQTKCPSFHNTCPCYYSALTNTAAAISAYQDSKEYHASNGKAVWQERPTLGHKHREHSALHQYQACGSLLTQRGGVIRLTQWSVCNEQSLWSDSNEQSLWRWLQWTITVEWLQWTITVEWLQWTITVEWLQWTITVEVTAMNNHCGVTAMNNHCGGDCNEQSLWSDCNEQSLWSDCNEQSLWRWLQWTIIVEWMQWTITVEWLQWTITVEWLQWTITVEWLQWTITVEVNAMNNQWGNRIIKYINDDTVYMYKMKGLIYLLWSHDKKTKFYCTD